MDAKLVMFKASGKTREFPLAKPVTVIGRSEECDLRIPLAEVSRKHCQVSVRGDAITIQDLESANGTFVNGQRIDQPASLKAGDRLAVGSVQFAVQVNGKGAETPPPAAAQPAAADEEVVELEAIPDTEGDEEIEPLALAEEDGDAISALEALAKETEEDTKGPKKKR